MQTIDISETTYISEKIECATKMIETTISSSTDNFEDQYSKTVDIRLDRESSFHCILRSHITTEQRMLELILQDTYSIKPVTNNKFM